MQWNLPVQVQAPVAVLGENLVVPVAAGTDAGLQCFRVGAKVGTPQLLWKKPLPGGVASSPVGFGSRLWCVTGHVGQGERHLFALDGGSGQTLWQQPVAAKASGVLVAAEDVVLAQDHEQELTCFGYDGKPLWAQQVGQLTHAPAVTKSMVVVAATQPPALIVLDRPTGRVLFRRGLEAPPTTSPLVRQHRILLGTAAALEARSLLDGSPLPGWSTDGGGVSANFAVLLKSLLYVSHKGELVVLDADTGKVQTKIPDAVPGRPPMVARDTVLYLGSVVTGQDLLAEVMPSTSAGAGGPMGAAAQPVLQAYPGREEWMVVTLQRDTAGAVVDADYRPSQWFEEEVGLLTTPWVLVDGYVYAGSAGKGLVRLGKK
jgi:outer membrane protein assembly factor BamB